MADHQNLPAYMYEDQGPKRIVIPAVMYGLAVLGVGLRFLSRRLSGSGLKLDDWLILSAMVC